MKPLSSYQADALKVLEGQCWRCDGLLQAGDCLACERHMEAGGEPGKLWLFDGWLGSSAYSQQVASYGTGCSHARMSLTRVCSQAQSGSGQR